MSTKGDWLMDVQQQQQWSPVFWCVLGYSLSGVLKITIFDV